MLLGSPVSGSGRGRRGSTLFLDPDGVFQNPVFLFAVAP